MIRQFYKAKIFIGKEANEKMVQKEVASFEPEVDKFDNVVNEGNEDLKITIGLDVNG